MSLIPLHFGGFGETCQIERTILSVRTLMDSASDIWCSGEFNNVQHALKNRILKEHPASSVHV